MYPIIVTFVTYVVETLTSFKRDCDSPQLQAVIFCNLV